MKYGIIKVKRAFLYEENGVDVVDEVFFGWSVMWEDEGEWIEVWKMCIRDRSTAMR